MTLADLQASGAVSAACRQGSLPLLQWLWSLVDDDGCRLSADYLRINAIFVATLYNHRDIVDWLQARIDEGLITSEPRP